MVIGENIMNDSEKLDHLVSEMAVLNSHMLGTNGNEGLLRRVARLEKHLYVASGCITMFVFFVGIALKAWPIR